MDGDWQLKLTFNATNPIVDIATAAGLVSYELPRGPGDRRRWVFCTRELQQFLTSGAPGSDFSPLQAQQLLGTFIRGENLGISQRRTRRRSEVDLERLEGMEEIWALCIRHPRPGWRILGRFLGRSVFVALEVKDKRDIGSDYGPIADEVKDFWKSIFGQRPPLVANWISGYIDGDHYDKDQQDGA